MRGDVLPRFLVLSVLVHGAILAAFHFGEWIPVPRPPPAPRGFDTNRARTVLERMKAANPDPAVAAAVPPEAEPAEPSAGDYEPRKTTGSLAPRNLEEILDRPLAAMEPNRAAPPTEEPRGTQAPSDLDRVWRESAQDLPSTGSGGRKPGNAPREDTGGTIVTEGFAVGGKGEVSRSQVDEALGKRLVQMQNCYQSALLENPGLTGKMLLRWTVSESGEVQGVLVEKSQFDNAELHSCIVQEIAKVQFPKPKGGSIFIRYPLNFSQKSN